MNTADTLLPAPPFPPTSPKMVVDAEALRGILGGVTVIDVRRPLAFSTAKAVIAGAIWRDPEAVAAWCGELPRDRPIVVYCKYGYEVSLFVATALRERGFDARSLAGGIAAWLAADGPTEPAADASPPPGRAS